MIEQLLDRWGIKSTANRMLVVKSLKNAHSPLSLIDLENELDTLDRSSISRVLSLLKEKGMVHEMEDGRGIAKYELCRHDHPSSECIGGEHQDLHPHFYCEKCGKTYCFDQMELPKICVPEGFRVRNINYMLKGICPECGGRELG